MQLYSNLFHELAHNTTLVSDRYYITSFSSVRSCLSYHIALTLNTGYYQIETYSGVVKYEGYLHTNLRECSDYQLNSYAGAIINNYLNWGTQKYRGRLVEIIN